jgi:hypothetical protein
VARGWVARNPEWADVPGADLELTGANYVTSHPTVRGTARATTGAYKPFGHRTDEGETVRGQNLCGGAVYRIAAEGEPERIAWGFRNPIGIALGGDGRLWATEGGMEERGSRPIAGAPDSLWEVQPGGYYGWPDCAAGLPVTDARFRLPGHPQPRKLLNRSPRVSGTPTALLPVRGGVGRVDFCLSDQFGFGGEAFVALSGPWSSPAYLGEEEIVGHRVVRVDTRTGVFRDFLTNRQAGPSSVTNGGGLERPFDVRFDPTGEVLYVVDMGEIQLSRENGLEPFGGTGVVWRITRIGATISIPARTGAETEEEAEQEAEGAEEEIIGVEAAAEIEAAGSSLDLEPPASDWLTEAPALSIPDETDERPIGADEPAEDEPHIAESPVEPAEGAPLPAEPEISEPAGNVSDEAAPAAEEPATEEPATEPKTEETEGGE